MKKSIKKLVFLIVVLMILSTILIIFANKQQDPVAMPVHETLSLAPLPHHETPTVSIETAQAEVLNLPNNQ